MPHKHFEQRGTQAKIKPPTVAHNAVEMPRPQALVLGCLRMLSFSALVLICAVAALAAPKAQAGASGDKPVLTADKPHSQDVYDIDGPGKVQRPVW